MKNKVLVGIITFLSIIPISYSAETVESKESKNKVEKDVFASWDNLKDAESAMNSSMPVEAGKDATIMKVIINKNDHSLSYYVGFHKDDSIIGFISFKKHLTGNEKARKMIIKQVCETGTSKILNPPLNGVVRYVYINSEGDYLDDVIITKKDCDLHIKEI